MRGYRLTSLGKIVVFSFIFLLILGTVFTVKALISNQDNGNSNLAITSDKVVPATQESQINTSEKYNTPNDTSADTSQDVNVSSLSNTTLTIYFEPDDDLIKLQYYEELDKFANIANILKDSTIEVEGNCSTMDANSADNKNNVKSYTLALSRAIAVFQYLQEKGIDPSRIVVIGNGSNKPIKPNTTEEDRKYNRRVDISFKLKNN